MKIIVCAYRSWATNVYEALLTLFPQVQFEIAQSPEQLNAAIEVGEPVEAVFCIGWSWLVEDSITDKYWVVGVHPSDLPDFAGGSPIQNQILAGVSQTKNSLFQLTRELDGGPVLAQVPLSLEGHMEDIFFRLQITSIVLLSDFIRQYPNVQILKKATGNRDKALHKRLKPNQSAISREDLSLKSAKELFDMIRCHESPYPNSYFEDETGRITFKFCEFSKAENDK